ncbi:ribosome alternative rescue factor ArfA, partial [Vibrio harveyi]
KKGKGSFNRKAKHRGKEPYSKFSLKWILNRAFFLSEGDGERGFSVLFLESKLSKP